jgi:hypothetical protein
LDVQHSLRIQETQEEITKCAIRYFITLTVSLAVTGVAHAEPYAPKVGQRHADFTLPDIHTGKAVSLSDFRGKKVLLIQFAS